MQYYHGLKKKSYFEGWYFKHQSEDQSIAFIPAIFTDEKGKTTAVMQIINNNHSWRVEFEMVEVNCEKEQLSIRMGDCFFSSRGIVLDINEEDIQVHAKIEYEDFLELDKDIMGPFKYFPMMECKHGIISLFHHINGFVEVNGEKIVFNNDIGYIETDYGKSFPENYTWTHATWEDENENAIMVAAATIPYLKVQFLGCISCVLFEGKQMVFATYFGAKVKKLSKDEIEIIQGKYRLEVKCLKKNPILLSAPKLGGLKIPVYENLISTVQYKLYEDKKCILDKVIKNASFE